MCKQRTLHHTEHGYVIQCKDCKHLRVAFGSFAITRTTAEFFEFKKTISEFYEMYKYAPDIMPEQKCIEIPTPLRSTYLVFSLDELRQLLELINEASTRLESEKFISNKINQN
jgi:hypothetical protein